MVSFCGDQLFSLKNATRETISIQQKECLIDLVSLLLNCIFVLTSFAFLLWLHLMKGNSSARNSVIMFVDHTSRWILSICLIIVYISQVAEGIVSHSRKSVPFGSDLHVLVTPAVGVVSAFQSIIYYHQVETNNSAKMLVLLLVYWPLSVCTKMANIFILYENGFGMHHLRLQLTWASLVLYFMLCGVEVTVFLQQKYLSKEKDSLPVERDLTNILYRHHYSNLVSKSTFSWIIPLLRLGYQRPLELEDLGTLPEEETAEFQFTRFYDVYTSEKNKTEIRGKKLSLWKCYLRTFWQTLFLGGIIKIVGDLVGLVGPLSITVILTYVGLVTKGEAREDSDDHRLSTLEFLQNGYIMACIVLLATFLQSTFSNNFNHLAIIEGVHLRTALQGLIYRKSLRMTSAGLDAGEVVNHMSVDAFNMMMLFSMGHYIWAVPVKIILLLVLLYLQLGYSAVIGAATIYVLSPLQYRVCTLLSRIQKESMKVADERLKRTSELLQGIKLLKLYGWESMYARLIIQVREKELELLRKDAIYVALNTFITQASSILVTLVTFAIYSEIEGKPLSPSEVFTGLALFNQLTVPLYIIPFVIPIVVNAVVSTKRLTKFLSMPEVESNVPWRDEAIPLATVEFKPDSGSVLLHLKDRETERLNSPFNFEDTDGVFLPEIQNHVNNSDGQYAVTVQDGRFVWSLEQTVPELRDINIQVPTGKLTVLVGTVGSGKSSLLCALLGEMTVARGLVKWASSTQGVAYVPQRPWLLNATLKENILFGQAYDGRRYNQIIQACALQPDIDLLPAKDLTEIGERGVNLSGGQRQRIALARAFYSQSRTVILDDPLSALDAHVGSHVFENGIKTLLLRRHRTVILVTNKMEYLTQASKILVLESGKVKEQGTYNEIETSSPDLVKSWKKIVLAKVLQKDHLEEGTTHERYKLLRLLSRQVLYRIASKQDIRTRPRFVSLSRQMSHDPSSPLPCHDYSDNEFQWPMVSDTSDRIGTSRSEANMSSSDSLNTKSSSSSGVFLRHPWKRRPPSRLNSRISGHTSDLIEEEDEEADETDDLKTTHGSRNKLETPPSGKLVIAEDRERGKISRKVYLSYMKACSLPMALAVIFLIVTTQTVKVVTDFWLSKWSEVGNDTNATVAQAQAEAALLHSYLIGYAIFSAVGIALSLVTNLTAQLTSLKAVRSLHENMLQNIVHCPMKFFDTTPVGRVLNRFASDVSTIDKKLPITLPMLLRFVLLCVSAIIVDIIVTPYFLLIIVPILAIYYFLQHFFRFTSREIQRIDSVTKSPIFGHFSETLSGLTTIRAFQEEKRFISQLNTYININNTAFVLMNCANCWLGIALDYLGGIILFVATISAMTAAIYGHVSLSFVGMAMTYTLLVPIYLNWVVRNLANVEMYMNAVERVQAYTSLPVEAFTGLNAEVPKNWPVVGEIKYVGVTLKYDTAPDAVLRNVTLTIKHGEKVGVCGRTGNGKSSLVMALFRMLTIIEGKITIDGVDITTLPLELLRSRLSIIPQDTVLFSGTIRENLDPGSQFTDEEIWKALEIAQLKDVVQNQHTGLDAEVAEEGSNFSIGQRQLFCLARAILRKSSILVMDEATSSLDAETDEILQSVVSSHCKDCTILAIAHRVKSLLSYDRVLVLDSGRIAEDGKPTVLMEQKGSIFSSLVKASQPT